jgi:two-component system, cell cycle sensor histidine kinase and response regulator CckA
MSLPLTKSLETILVVEDNPVVMKPVVMMLQHAGFNVLSASGAQEAIQVESEFAEIIHLLLSDVMMPGMAGPVLAKQLQQKRPHMRVVLMSGFTDGAVLLLNHGWHFIAKPFQANALLNRVNDALHTHTRAQETDRFDTRR